MKILILSLFLLMPALSHARLGETYDQCVARYGAPAEEGTILVGGIPFVKGDFIIIAYFNDDNICDALIIGRIAEDEISNNNITDLEQQELTRLNIGDNFEHATIGDSPGYLNPITGSASFYDILEDRLFIFTMPGYKRMLANRKKDTETSLDGF